MFQQCKTLYLLLITKMLPCQLTRMHFLKYPVSIYFQSLPQEPPKVIHHQLMASCDEW